MKRRVVRALVLLWLGWYLSGPIAETFDSWDSPRQEMGDIARSAGGAVTLVAIVACFGIALFKKLSDRCSFPAKTIFARLLPESLEFQPSFQAAVPATSFHSPPFSLRV